MFWPIKTNIFGARSHPAQNWTTSAGGFILVTLGFNHLLLTSDKPMYYLIICNCIIIITHQPDY